MTKKQRTICITGTQGMDGSILMDHFLEQGDRVIGIDTWRPEGAREPLKRALKNDNFTFLSGDITERDWMTEIIKTHKPDMFFNMAAISLVPESFKIPLRVLDVNAMAVLNMLEAIRHYSPETKFYQASTSEQIGDNTEPNQNLDSKMRPNSPYAVSKLASFHFTRLYRQAYGLFCVNGMLWNHEGERRGPMFVTRKITKHVARQAGGEENILYLGNLNSGRDWGYAPDYCKAMVMMLEQDEPRDYAVSTGETHTVRDFVEAAFNTIGIELTWEGEGLDEVGKDQNDNIRVAVSEEWYRPQEVEYLHGDPSRTKELLGWEPSVTFEELVKIMVMSDMKEIGVLKTNNEGKELLQLYDFLMRGQE